MKYCGNCGFKLNAEAKFCPNCGKNLSVKRDDASEFVSTPVVPESTTPVVPNVTEQKPPEKKSAVPESTTPVVPNVSEQKPPEMKSAVPESTTPVVPNVTEQIPVRPAVPESTTSVVPNVSEQKPIRPAVQNATAFAPVNMAKKGKSRKGLFMGLAAVLLIFLAGIFFVYKLFFSGPEKLTAEYKFPDKKKIVKSDSGMVAPANMFGIMMKEGYGKGDAKDVAELVNGKVVGEIEIANTYQVEFDGKTMADLKSALKKAKESGKVEAAFADVVLRPCGAENSSCNPFEDPMYEGEKGKAYEMINLKRAWDIIRASGVKLNSVKVGVIDTKIDFTSDELNTGKIKTVPYDKKSMDVGQELPHSNMVTSVIAGNLENGGVFGTASILGENLQVTTNTFSDDKMVKTKSKEESDEITDFDSKKAGFTNGGIYTIESMKEIQKQIEGGATIINCSFGNPLTNENQEYNENISMVYKYIIQKIQKKYPNVIIVGSAGNDGKIIEKNRLWGHQLDNLITVGALGTDGRQAGYSNYADITSKDDEVTVSACGTVVMEDGKINYGTSLTTPQVTGLIAMMRSINPKLTPAEIKKILVETSVDKNRGRHSSPLIQADDAILRTIESATGKKWDKDKLLSMMKVDVKSDGASPEFKVTASILSASESGTKLEIECTGGDYALGGDKIKELSSAGSVTWKLTVPKPETILSVKVTRLDTKACMTILVGGKIEAKDLVGTWEGGTCWEAWSTPYKIAEPEIRKNLKQGKGEYTNMTMTMTLVSENTLQAVMNAGGNSNPNITFNFSDGNLTGSGSDAYNKYNFSGSVKSEGGMYHIAGEWSSSNNAMKMNGRWKASMKVK